MGKVLKQIGYNGAVFKKPIGEFFYQFHNDVNPLVRESVIANLLRAEMCGFITIYHKDLLTTETLRNF